MNGSTRFGRFLLPSSGSHNCTHSYRYCQAIVLQAGIVDGMAMFRLVHDTTQQQYWLTTPVAVCTVM